MTVAPTHRSPIGERLPRERARRIVRGKGRYTDDIPAARAVHVVFLRSPHAHARIVNIDLGAALASPGVVYAATGRDLLPHYAPWRVKNDLFSALKTDIQHALAVDKARFQGEPVVAVVARTRALAEDAAERVAIDYEVLPAVVDPDEALAPGSVVVNEALGTNLAFEGQVATADFERVFAEAEHRLRRDFVFNRHTAVCLEPRAVLASYDETVGALTVYQGAQVPWHTQDMYSAILGIPEHRISVIAPDIGGAFGIKQQLYGDELATCVLAMILKRPVKFTADRLESMLADNHAKDHRIRAEVAFNSDGEVKAIALDDTAVIGAYSQFPRSSLGEGRHIMLLTGAAYRLAGYRARLRAVYQNKNPIGHYRGVGQPMATAIGEALIDAVAHATGRDPLDVRLANAAADGPPHTSGSGLVLPELATVECLKILERKTDYRRLRGEQENLRRRGVYRGLGLAVFVELVATGSEYYGAAGVNASSQDGCILRLEPSGLLRCLPSTIELGQGIDTGIQQVVAATFGVPAAAVAVESGNSAVNPYGSGAWASRGAVTGAEAAFGAAKALRLEVLRVAAALHQTSAERLDIVDGSILAAGKEGAISTVADIARLVHFQPHLLPDTVRPNLTATCQYNAHGRPYLTTSGVQLSHVEVDVESGFVKLLSHAVVHDSGTIINPLLVDEQIRGGVVQGIGAALLEECGYDGEGQFTSASLADYLVPMAVEMPDIEVHHVSRPTQTSGLGTRGVGEAGTTGAMSAVLNAINDAIAPFDARVTETPCSPYRILKALRTLD